MASMEQSISVDVRKIAREHIKFSIQYKNIFWFKIGLAFIKFGCWLVGAELVDEFPMSLYQDIGKDAL